MIRTLILAAAAFALAGCATTPPRYAAATAPGASGYSEQQIESNRYFVTYRTQNATEAGLLRDYALLRAADIAMGRGAEWFWLDNTSFEDASVYHTGPSIGIGIGGASFGGHSAVGGSVGMNFPIGGSNGQQARAARLEIRLGQGQKPDDANTYSARDTAATIRARVGAAG